MRILITNDDGIHAPGLEVCEKIARELSDEIWIVAPESDQSGVSHSLSLNDPLRLREVAERHFAVKGTPTDCVIMGARHLMKQMPDLVLSGVNRGRNCAEDVTYSGTIAGAMEGCLLGIPSIAFSQPYTQPNAPKWETSTQFGAEVARRALGMGIPRNVLINVNFPDVAPSAVKGMRVTRQGVRGFGGHIVERTDPRGGTYYWIAYSPGEHEHDDESDLTSVRSGYVSVTPLHLDLTHEATRRKLAAQFAD